ncbi:MAG: TonB-dependent receptor, partial [Desulfobacterales bacterium]
MKQFHGCILIPMLFISVLVGHLLSEAGAAEFCEDWAGRAVSVQGGVHVRRAGTTRWDPVRLNDTFCPGDMIQVREYSRAAVLLSNDAILRLDQKTTILFPERKKEPAGWIDLFHGAVHFFSRDPRRLEINTPFVNAAVGGTEFYVRVERDQTFVCVFEGRVAATNKDGSLVLASGQAAVAQAGKAPVPYTVVHPRDAVQWALYYPPIIDYNAAEYRAGPAAATIQQALDAYRKGDLAGALTALGRVPETVRDAQYFNLRAGLLLSAGRVDEAHADIGQALKVDPRNGTALALRSIIAVVQNEKDQALELSNEAAQLGPQSPVPRVALSYAYQANFEIEKALDNAKQAVELDPENALAWARLSELQLAVGELDRALKSAQEAVARNPNLARTQTVLGFAHLTRIAIDKAQTAFEHAIELDQVDPMPRLGLGLAKIRRSDLAEGRQEIEIAASLDPNNALIRSYMGKAYFEEKRENQAGTQFDIAKKLDPKDPTAWFYDAILKQSVNRPVEALHDLQKSIELNDNRAVYRSQLLLDQDLAARSASLGRIYRDLGFEQLALVEGWKSVNTDPSNYSAHRFLADTYSILPRHETARVSELLQSQLLQPINITPVQPQLAETNLFILEGAGPADPAFNEFNPLFLRNRFALQASGVAGGNDTLGDEITQSGVWGRWSYSLGQFHFETDGFRENNDQEQDIFNVFSQVSLSQNTSILAEWRYADRDEGDLPLRFPVDDQENFSLNRRKERKTKSIRLGLRHSFSPGSDVITHFSYLDAEETGHDVFGSTPLDTSVNDTGYMAEAQHLFKWRLLSLTSGIGHFDRDREKTISFLAEDTTRPDVLHTNLYLYPQIHFPKNFTWTIGGSADFYDDDETKDRDQFNPKFGLTWTPLPGTTLRAAGFRTLKRSLISRQTIEPSQVAGFNQFF